VRPQQAEGIVTPDEEAIVRERLSTFDEDKKAATPWREAKRRRLEQPLPR
jgi:hypothetical protein